MNVEILDNNMADRFKAAIAEQTSPFMLAVAPDKICIKALHEYQVTNVQGLRDMIEALTTAADLAEKMAKEAK